MIFFHILYIFLFFFDLWAQRECKSKTQNIMFYWGPTAGGAIWGGYHDNDMPRHVQSVRISAFSRMLNYMQTDYKPTTRVHYGTRVGGRALERRGGDWTAHCSRRLHHQGALHTPPIVHQEKSFPAQLRLLLRDWKLLLVNKNLGNLRSINLRRII